MQYILQVTIYSALFYAVYLLFLKNRASHQWNRFYLLLCAGLPMVIPFIKVPAFYLAIPASGVKTINAIMPALTIFAQKPIAVTASYVRDNVLVIGYLIASLIILMNIIYQFFLFKRFVNQHKYEVINRVKVLRDTNAGPGSFLNYMFLPGKEINPVIFGHELAHIQLKHSRDILFIRLLQCVFWPNIVLYFILRELKVVHEFQADARAVRHEESYISTLLNDFFSTRQFSLGHTFFYHPLKRRIMMLQSPVSSTKLRLAKCKMVIAATMLTMGFIYLQSCTHPGSKNVLPGAAARADSEYSTVTMPTVSYDLHDYLIKNIKYPEVARKKGIEGRVMVRFVVDENGDIVNPQILRSPDTVLSTEALRVIGQMPKWIPGKLNGKPVAKQFNLPIVFMLENNVKKNAGSF